VAFLEWVTALQLLPLFFCAVWMQTYGRNSYLDLHFLLSCACSEDLPRSTLLRRYGESHLESQAGLGWLGTLLFVVVAKQMFL